MPLFVPSDPRSDALVDLLCMERQDEESVEELLLRDVKGCGGGKTS